MARNRVSVKNDKGMARAFMKGGTSTRRYMASTAQLAGINYRRYRRKYDSPSYPFENLNDPTVRKLGGVAGNGAWQVRTDSTGVSITVAAVGAYWEDQGNTPGPIRPTGGSRALALPYKRSHAVSKPLRNKPGVRYYTRSGSKLKRGRNGRLYLLVPQVKAYPGRGLIRKAMRAAFGRKRVV